MVCVWGGGGGESIPDEQLPFQYIVKKKPAATCPRVLLQIGNRQIVYCKIRFPRERSGTNKLLISYIVSSLS